MLIPHKGHTDTIQVYSVTVMTHVKALQAGHSSQGTSEPITPVAMDSVWQDPFDSQPMLRNPTPATLQHRVGSVMPAASESPPRVTHSSADRELLIQSCEIAPEHYSRTVAGKRVGIYVTGYASGGTSHGRKDISASESASRGGGGGGGGASPLTNDLWKRDQCCSCGLHGHRVNRCSRLDITFPCVLPGWSVDVRNGQYRASRMHGNGQDRRRGKERWFGREGQPPGPLMIVTHLTQVGGHHPAWRQPKDGIHRTRWTLPVQGFPALGSLTPAEKKPT